MRGITKKGMLWNLTGCFLFALASIVLMAVVKRAVGEEQANTFSIAFTLAQTFITIGYFEVRTFQITDVGEIYSFQDYWTFRMITCVCMMAVSVGYVIFHRDSLSRALIILGMCLYKMADAYADVYEGDYQKNNRIDLTGKSLTLRTTLTVVIFSLTLFSTRNLIVASAICACSSLICIGIVNPRLRKSYCTDKRTRPVFNFRKCKGLGRDCLFLALGAFMCIYIFNAAKYAMDTYHNEVNYICSALLMPTSVINLIGGIIFRPFLNSLADLFNEKRYVSFMKMVGIFLLGTMAITLVCLIGAWLLGVPVLSAIYDIDLSPYKTELLLLIAGGGCNAGGILVYYGLTVMRKQGFIFGAYGVVFILAMWLPGVLVKEQGIAGGAIAYVCLMAIQLMLFAIGLFTMTLMISKKDSLKEMSQSVDEE